VVTQKGLVLFSLAGIFWGLPYFFIALALESFSTPSIVFLRTFLGALVLIPYAALTGGLKPALRAWPYVLVFGAVEMVGPWFLITEAEKHISSGLAGLLIATVPFFAVAVLAIFLKDRKALKLKPLSGMIIGFVGVFTLVGIDSVTGAVNPLYVLMVVLAAVGYSIAPIVANIKLHDVPSAGVIGVSMAFVAIVYSPFSLPQLPSELSNATTLSLMAGGGAGTCVLGCRVRDFLQADQGSRACEGHPDYLCEHRCRSLAGHHFPWGANHRWPIGRHSSNHHRTSSCWRQGART
jgi:drug/metabolite transporter (DMT)-like permease